MKELPIEELRRRAARISLLILDVDGVLTDGSIVYSDRGEELKCFHVRDGAGIKRWQAAGHTVAILSGRSSPAVDRRAAELGITLVQQGIHDKAAALREILSETSCTPEEAAAMGDDLPDLPVLKAVGLAVVPADACSEAREAAHHATIIPGGRGAVREAVDWLLRLQATEAGQPGTT